MFDLQTSGVTPHVCDYDTVPPENQVRVHACSAPFSVSHCPRNAWRLQRITTDTTNILIRSLMHGKSKENKVSLAPGLPGVVPPKFSCLVSPPDDEGLFAAPREHRCVDPQETTGEGS